MPSLPGDGGQGSVAMVVLRVNRRRTPARRQARARRVPRLVVPFAAHRACHERHLAEPSSEVAANANGVHRCHLLPRRGSGWGRPISEPLRGVTDQAGDTHCCRCATYRQRHVGLLHGLFLPIVQCEASSETHAKRPGHRWPMHPLRAILSYYCNIGHTRKLRCSMAAGPARRALASGVRTTRRGVAGDGCPVCKRGTIDNCCAMGYVDSCLVWFTPRFCTWRCDEFHLRVVTS